MEGRGRHTPLSRIIEDKVCAEFDVPVEQASADAQEFVEKLAEHGILLSRTTDSPKGGSMSLLEEMNQKATAQGIPLSAHMDITWNCNERCVHCYLDHEGKDEMTTAEIKDVIRQLAECGTFFLSISGGEPLLRRDCFEILEYARALRFNVKLKTNAVMIGAKEAARLKQARHRAGADQHLFAPPRDSRRDHQAARFAAPHDRAPSGTSKRKASRSPSPMC